MKITKRKLMGAVAVTALGGLIAFAADKGNPGTLSSRDYKFVCDAAQGGMMEVSMGQLAQQQGSSQAVRDFGQRMTTDHQKADQELMDLIGHKGTSLPDTTADDAKSLNHYRSLSGTTFDTTYAKEMVNDHKKDIKSFQTEAEKGDDPDVRNWASKTLPTLQEHLSLAESMQASVEAMKQ